MNPMDRHKKEYDNRMLALKEHEFASAHDLSESETTYKGLPARVLGRAYFDIDRDINSRKYRRYGFKGGRGSLKSSYCGLKVVDQIMLNPSMCAMAVRELADDLRDSVYAQIVWAIDELGLSNLFKCTTNPMQILRKETGQIIYFRAGNKPSKIKSIKPPKGMTIGILWIEEADQISGMEAVRNIMQSCFRGVGNDDGITLYSYNTPVSQAHYINKESLVDDPTRIIHYSSYLDAPSVWHQYRPLARTGVHWLAIFKEIRLN